MQNSVAIRLWLAGWTQQEIAEATGWSQPAITSFIKNENDFLSDKTVASKANHATDFDVPILDARIVQTQSDCICSQAMGQSGERYTTPHLPRYLPPNLGNLRSKASRIHNKKLVRILSLLGMGRSCDEGC
jgi:predicted transcriptional regulator